MIFSPNKKLLNLRKKKIFARKDVRKKIFFVRKIKIYELLIYEADENLPGFISLQLRSATRDRRQFVPTRRADYAVEAVGKLDNLINLNCLAHFATRGSKKRMKTILG